MADWGFFTVDRGLWGHPFFKPEPFTERESWVWLISAAAFKPIRVAYQGIIVLLERAEFCYSLRFMAEKWRWEKTRVERYLKRLENHDMIRDTSRDGAKVYSITNYNRFNSVTLQDRDTNRDTARDRTATPSRQDRDKEEKLNNSTIETSPLSDLQSDPLPIASNNAPKPKAAKAAYSSLFEEFWKAYPTDKNMSKLMAFGAWQRLSDEDRRAAIAAVPGYKSWISKQQNYRTLHAIRFLSQRRFEGFAVVANDDPATAKAREWFEKNARKPQEVIQ